MAEIVTLTSPPPALTTYRVNEIYMNWDAASIHIGLKGTNGEAKHHSISGAQATTLMNALNKANLTSNSLHKRAIQRCIDDGVIAGAISGSPD